MVINQRHHNETFEHVALVILKAAPCYLTPETDNMLSAVEDLCPRIVHISSKQQNLSHEPEHRL